MKLHHLLRAFVGIFCAISQALAQGVVSQLGGFSEQVQDLPALVAATPPSSLDLFLQQGQPSFPILAPNNLAGTNDLLFPAPAPAPASGVPATVLPLVLQPSVPVFKPVGAAVGAKPKGLLTLRSLRVANSGPEGSKISFGPAAEYAMGTDSAGNFVVQKAAAPQPVLALDSSNVLHLASGKVEAQALDAGSISVRGVKQWSLVYSDDFSAVGTGWSRPDVTQCGGVSMLGGYCKFSGNEVNKTFGGLPPHKQLRVVAKYHFIDRWMGETGYMKLNIGSDGCPVPVWSEQHKQEEVKNGFSLCGGPTPEGKFSAQVDVTVPHHQESVEVTFGSTIGDSDACDESWGISAVEIYARG